MTTYAAPEKQKKHYWTFWQVLAMVFVFATLPAAGAIWVIDRNSDTASDRTDTLQCERGNLVRGYLLARSNELPPTDTGAQAEVLLPLLNCPATVKEKREAEDEGRDPRGMPLDIEQSARYQTVLSRGRLPIVKDGKVVGSEPLP